jgi:NitT/TauT family transport system substrate-binding protein
MIRMSPPPRFLLRFIVGCALCLGLATTARADPLPVRVSLPGPHSLSYLPIELIPLIGADAAEGLSVSLKYVPGGSHALRDLRQLNADFAAAGQPAAMAEQVRQGGVTTLLAVNERPLLILMLRADLKGKVRRIADLRGRTVGVNSSTSSTKTTSQQAAELVLKAHGVTAMEANLVPAGQSYQDYDAALTARAVDAILGVEPFASQLRDEGKVSFLFNLNNPADAASVPGAGFLYVALHTRTDIVRQHPQLAERMTRATRRVLAWIAERGPAEVAARLHPQDAAARERLRRLLTAYPHLFSRDGRFSARQLAETDRFFQAAYAEDPRAGQLRVAQMIERRWAGEKE